MGGQVVSSYNKLMLFIKRMLSLKHSGTFIIFIVFAVKTIQLIYLFDTRSDLSHQVWYAQSLTEGKSIGPAIVEPNDLSQIHYTTDIKWPPGYSVFMALVLFIFNKDYIVAAMVLNLLAAFALIIISRKILKLFDLPEYLVNLFTIVSGLSLYYFQLKPSTDAIAVTFFMLAAYYALWIMKYKEKIILLILGITAALMICVSLKYLYIPIVFSIPLALWFAGYKDKHAQLKRLSILSFFFIAAVTVSLLLWQKAHAGSLAYVQQTERGLFPGNLLEFHPFLTATFIKPETLWILFDSSPGSWQILSNIFQFLHLVVLALIVYFILKYARRRIENLSPIFTATILLILAACIITSFLSTLSLFIAPEQVHDGSTWTYVQEARYYGLLHVLIPILVFAAYHVNKNYRIKKLMFILVILLLPEMFRGLIFSANRIVNFQKETYGWQHELKFQKYTDGLMQEIQRQNNGLPIVLAGSSDWMTLRAVLYSRKPLLENVNSINQLESINSSKPTILFMIMRHSDKPRFQPFLQKAKDHLIGNYLQFDYYAIPITAR